MTTVSALRKAVPSVRSAVVTLLLCTACSGESSLLSRRNEPTTAYNRYARSLLDAGLDSTALGREWLAASDSAMRSPLTATLPALEVGTYTRSEARAVAHQFALKDGQRVTVRLRVEGLPARLYLDLFEASGDTLRPFTHRATADTVASRDSVAAQLALDYEAREDGEYVLRLQPELLRSGRYELSIGIEPILAFPVEGRGNAAIRSFFGAERDAGRRMHHGIDIFAPRGTPVLAATDGVVRSILPSNLGGNVVWLTDDVRRQSLYYAHLDTQVVAAGQRVQQGDTLGFVGSTGNARATPPHLHFGIYRRGRGPIDPLLHVQRVMRDAPPLKADTALIGATGKTKGAVVRLRGGPSVTSALLQVVAQNVSVQIMGVSANWFRVQLPDGSAGYLAADAIRRVE